MGGDHSPVYLAHPVLYLPMGLQGTRCQVRIALRAVDPLAESIPVSETLSCHLEAIGLRVEPPCCEAGLAHQLDYSETSGGEYDNIGATSYGRRRGGGVL